MWKLRRFDWVVILACAACTNNGGRSDAASAAGSLGSPAALAGKPAETAGSAASAPVPSAGRAGSFAAIGGSSAGHSGGAVTAGDRAQAGNLSPDDADAGTPSDAGTGSPDAAVEQPRSTGPGDWTAGDYPPDLTQANYLELSGLPGQAGNARQYKVHVPPSYDPKLPMPVVFCIHGLGQDALLFCVSGANMPAKADAAGFILVMPNGYQNSWNAGTCCGGAVDDELDDVGFMRALFDELSKHLNIDLTRVYATGLSNGGYMSYRLACEASDLFVAVAPGAGAIGMSDIGGGTSTESDLAACKPAQKVSVLDLHGTADPLIPYSLQKPSLDRIAEQNGCTLTTHPASQPASSGDTTCLSYDCPAGIDVTGCSVQDGGHVWFGSDNCGTGVDFGCDIVGANSQTLVNTDAVWTFFSSHSRP